MNTRFLSEVLPLTTEMEIVGMISENGTDGDFNNWYFPKNNGLPDSDISNPIIAYQKVTNGGFTMKNGQKHGEWSEISYEGMRLECFDMRNKTDAIICKKRFDQLGIDGSYLEEKNKEESNDLDYDII